MARITEIFDEDTPMPDAPPLSEYESLSLEPLTLSQEDLDQPARQRTDANDSPPSRAVSQEDKRMTHFRPPPRDVRARRVPTRSEGIAPVSHSQVTVPSRARRDALFPAFNGDDLSDSEYRRPEYTVKHATSLTTVHKTRATVETYRTVYNGRGVEFERTVLTQKHTTKRKVTETIGSDPKRRRHHE
ncbi:hypothetical protein FSARC_13334 [Fusarium sarcochroum]|uniref:Uncharacterized protein n=1 Tax=Fusarium sarcochroum TaxID=1208366 RepID=A0A8H4T272_9HYPO|nr:hypothetical protein FSARC_13334 [Fusarium sarcochroum]